MSSAACPCCPGGERAADACLAYPGQPAPLLLVAEITVSYLVHLSWPVLERNKVSSGFLFFFLQPELSSHLVLSEAGWFPGGTLFCVR